MTSPNKLPRRPQRPRITYEEDPPEKPARQSRSTVRTESSLSNAKQRKQGPERHRNFVYQRNRNDQGNSCQRRHEQNENEKSRIPVNIRNVEVSTTVKQNQDQNKNKKENLASSGKNARSGDCVKKDDKSGMSVAEFKPVVTSTPMIPKKKIAFGERTREYDNSRNINFANLKHTEPMVGECGKQTTPKQSNTIQTPSAPVKEKKFQKQPLSNTIDESTTLRTPNVQTYHVKERILKSSIKDEVKKETGPDSNKFESPTNPTSEKIRCGLNVLVKRVKALDSFLTSDGISDVYPTKTLKRLDDKWPSSPNKNRKHVLTSPSIFSANPKRNRSDAASKNYNEFEVFEDQKIAPEQLYILPTSMVPVKPTEKVCLEMIPEADDSEQVVPTINFAELNINPPTKEGQKEKLKPVAALENQSVTAINLAKFGRLAGRISFANRSDDHLKKPVPTINFAELKNPENFIQNTMSNPPIQSYTFGDTVQKDSFTANDKVTDCSVSLPSFNFVTLKADELMVNVEQPNSAQSSVLRTPFAAEIEIKADPLITHNNIQLSGQNIEDVNVAWKEIAKSIYAPHKVKPKKSRSTKLVYRYKDTSNGKWKVRLQTPRCRFTVYEHFVKDPLDLSNVKRKHTRVAPNKQVESQRGLSFRNENVMPEPMEQSLGSVSENMDVDPVCPPYHMEVDDPFDQELMDYNSI